MLAQPDRRDAMTARQFECRFAVDAQELRGFDGREKRFPHPLDLCVIRTDGGLHMFLLSSSSCP